jgi:hypothetical protein
MFAGALFIAAAPREAFPHDFERFGIVVGEFY